MKVTKIVRAGLFSNEKTALAKVILEKGAIALYTSTPLIRIKTISINYTDEITNMFQPSIANYIMQLLIYREDDGTLKDVVAVIRCKNKRKMKKNNSFLYKHIFFKYSLRTNKILSIYWEDDEAESTTQIEKDEIRLFTLLKELGKKY